VVWVAFLIATWWGDAFSTTGAFVSCKASMDPTRGSPHVSPRIAAQLLQDFHSFGVRQLYQKRRTRKIDAPLNRLGNATPHPVLGSPFGPSMKPVNRLAHALFRTLIKDVDDSEEVVQHVQDGIGMLLFWEPLDEEVHGARIPQE